MSQKTSINAIPLPCPILSKEIGLLENELRHASPAQAKQLESIIASLQKTYRTQCEHAGPSPQQQFVTSAHMFSEGLAFHFVGANGVRVIFGGNDGILVTIDGAGHIHVYPSQGPGDPELRSAMASVMQGMKTLTAGAQAQAA